MTDDGESGRGAPTSNTAILQAITELMLGEQPHLTRAEVSERSGVDPDLTRRRWRAMGFPEADDDDVAFTQADVEALRVTQELIGLGVIEPDTEQAIIRSIGRSFARLADWQVRTFLSALTSGAEAGFAVATSASWRRSSRSANRCTAMPGDGTSSTQRPGCFSTSPTTSTRPHAASASPTSSATRR